MSESQGERYSMWGERYHDSILGRDIPDFAVTALLNEHERWRQEREAREHITVNGEPAVPLWQTGDAPHDKLIVGLWGAYFYLAVWEPDYNAWRTPIPNDKAHQLPGQPSQWCTLPPHADAAQKPTETYCVSCLQEERMAALREEIARLKAKFDRLSKCPRCGCSDRVLDVVTHCSTCYAEAQATITTLKAQIAKTLVETDATKDALRQKIDDAAYALELVIVEINDYAQNPAACVAKLSELREALKEDA